MSAFIRQFLSFEVNWQKKRESPVSVVMNISKVCGPELERKVLCWDPAGRECLDCDWKRGMVQ